MRRVSDTCELSSIDGTCQVCKVMKEFKSNGLIYEIGDTVVTVYHEPSRTVYVCLLSEITDATDNYGCIYGLKYTIKHCATSAELNRIETFSRFNEYFRPIQDLTESIQQYDSYVKSIYAERCAAIKNENNNRSWLRKVVDNTFDTVPLVMISVLTAYVTGMLLLLTSPKVAIIFGVITLFMISLMIVKAYDSAQYDKIYKEYSKPMVLPYSKWKNTQTVNILNNKLEGKLCTN